MTGRAVLARAAAVALALLVLPGAGRAADDRLRPLSYDLAVDGTVTGSSAAATLVLEFLLKDDLAPRACRWCQPGPLDGPLSRSAAWSDPHAADTSSTVLALAVPAGLLGYGLAQAYRLGDPAAGWADVLLVVEAGSLAMVANEGVKYLAGRARPYAWQGRPGLYGDAAEQNVVAGAAVGSLVGWAVPYLFHRRKAAEPEAVRLVPGGIALAW